MPFSAQQMSDRMEISDTITRYSYVVDQRVWQDWHKVFTPDATIDYSFWGMEVCSPSDLREMMLVSHASRISGQHLLHNQLIELTGDSAHVHTEFTLNVLMESDRSDSSHRRLSGGWYEDRLSRTSEGWRVVARRGFGKWMVRDEVEAQEAFAHQPWLQS